MNILSTIKNLFVSKPKAAPAPPRLSPPPPEPEEDEIEVPEITVEALQTKLAQTKVTQATSPHLLDVREPYEWSQVRMNNAQHIPMNEIPTRLDELPNDASIIVFCAHGQRSYGVAHYLIENGFDATSLAGGITDWAAKGFKVDVGAV